MTFADDNEVLLYIKNNQSICSYIKRSREQTTELKALVSGKMFTDYLIKKIEHIEGEKRAIARKKYSRSVIDLFERLLRPIDNVYHSTGGSTHIKLNPNELEVTLNSISKIRDGLSLGKWLEQFWMPLYHNDPAGVVFLEYKVENDRAYSYPTYKSINSIRKYEAKGQKCEVILFEPVKAKDSTGDYKIWRVVDDLKDYTVIQRGENYTVSEELTFEHPFGECPALINSNIIDILDDDYLRKSPINPICETSKEYAQNQSIKTVYKFLHGIPIQWRYVTVCRDCHGTKKKGNSDCPTCDAKGFYESKDVTDIVNLPTPTKDTPILQDIAGYISPDLDTWTQYTEELKFLENTSFKTHWGTVVEAGANETATGRFIDVQPVMNRLNKYADVSEYMENQLTEWIINGLIPSKNKEEKVVAISYGRRYIIESPDVILEKYEKAKLNGDATTILDRLFNEYLTAKYRNDPKWLGMALKKAEVEPLLHYTIEQVLQIWGNEKAQEKTLFEEFWKTLTAEEVLDNDAAKLKEMFKDWLEEQKPEEPEPIIEPTPEPPIEEDTTE